MAGWDPVRVKALLRAASQRLGQLQDKMESQAHITRMDIATLLQQGNVPIARAKANKLLKEENLSDVLETLEMHVGVVLGHLSEFEREPSSPVVIEATSTIIYAAPQLDYKELQVVRDFLVQRVGQDFTRSVTGNRDKYVSMRVLRALSAAPPPASKLDQYLYSIARANGVNWVPDLPPHEKVNALSQMLDPTVRPVVDVTRLRELCSHGLPEYPSWLRSRIWRLLLGTLPPEKMSWNTETKKNRESYYDLVRRLLEPFTSLPPPTTPPTTLDASLIDVSTGLSRVPPGLLAVVKEDPEITTVCPLDTSAPEDIRIPCADNLTLRLRQIREAEYPEETPADDMPEIRLDETPEIRLDNDSEEQSESSVHLDTSGGVTPGISLSAPDSPSSSHSPGPTTLVPSRAYSAIGGAHHKHASALLRLLYIHSCLNPASRSPHIASLLVPLYSAMIEEVELEEVAHVEADTFWLFEAMVGEFSELDDEEGEKVWTRKFGERLEWADPELADVLRTQGLDPALPHYSYRWLLPLLTHTLPLPYVLMVWDALFSRPMRDRDTNPKLDYLLDICTSMLLCAKDTLLRLGRPGRKLSNLWGDEALASSDSPLGAHELEDAFIEGMAFLQKYPLESVGGVDTILQLSFDLALRREAEVNAAKAAGPGLGARFRETVWKGLLNTSTQSGEDEDTESEGYDSEAEVEPSNVSVLTSRLAQSVWRGISNQSAMEPPPSPEPPVSPMPPLMPEHLEELPEVPPKEQPTGSNLNRGRSIWGYAEKLKESDAAATLAKVSTNWRVKAIDAWTKRPNVSSASKGPPPARSSGAASIDFDALRRGPTQIDDAKRQSLPDMDRSGVYSPPARPAHFRPVRDSSFFNRRGSTIFSSNGELSPMSDPGSALSPGDRGSLSFPTSDGRPGKSGPRPLLLNSGSLITASHSRSPTSTTITPSSAERWDDKVRGAHHGASRDSMSSASSVSPGDQFSRAQRRSTARSETDESGSRIVPLRGTPSPMARSRRTPASSVASSPANEHRRMPTETLTQQGSDDNQSAKGWERVDHPDSPPTAPSPPPPSTPEATATTNREVRVRPNETQRGSMVLIEPGEPVPAKPISEVRTSRRTPTLTRLATEGDTSDSSLTGGHTPTRVMRTKSKRLPPRLTSLRSKENSKTANEFGILDANSLAPSRSDDVESVVTPRATTFDGDVPGATPISPRPPRRIRKVSGESNGEIRRKISAEGRVRKVSTEGRTRKISAERDESKHKRADSAVEGDDEGYNDLLSAYESEDPDYAI